MPIYEYSCCSCHHTFEELILRADDEKKLVCPRCGSGKLNRLFSAFGVAGAEKNVKSTNSGCSSCSSHNCSACS
ncbi:MAG: FmdB family zinc ribbon protein [candidate division WOR-3 bacterium]